jgi:hypothetical protein
MPRACWQPVGPARLGRPARPLFGHFAADRCAVLGASLRCWRPRRRRLLLLVARPSPARGPQHPARPRDQPRAMAARMRSSFADRSFPASIEFSSQAVDGQSGTARMQLMVGNDEGLLLAGQMCASTCHATCRPCTFPLPRCCSIKMACALPPSGRAKRWCSRASKSRATLAAKSRLPPGFSPMTE